MKRLLNTYTPQNLNPETLKPKSDHDELRLQGFDFMLPGLAMLSEYYSGYECDYDDDDDDDDDDDEPFYYCFIFFDKALCKTCYVT